MLIELAMRKLFMRNAMFMAFFGMNLTESLFSEVSELLMSIITKIIPLVTDLYGVRLHIHLPGLFLFRRVTLVIVHYFAIAHLGDIVAV